MKILVDTCTFVWIITDTDELSTTARQLFVDPDNEVYLSVVSIWEILVKLSLGKLPLPKPPERFIPKQRERHGIAVLALEERAPLYLYKLPSLHKDPFDHRHLTGDVPGPQPSWC